MRSLSQTITGIICIFLVVPSIAQSPLQVADSLYQEGKNWYYDGKYQKALAPYQKALEFYQKELGEQAVPVVKTYRRIADTYRGLRRNERALDFYQKGLDIAVQLDSFPPEDIAEIYNRMGHAYGNLFLPVESSKYYHLSLDIFKELYGELSSQVGNAYMNIGISQTRRSYYHDGLKNFQKAFDIFTVVSEPNSVDFNRIYSNMGYLYRKMGDYDRSIRFAEKALEIKLLNYPADHPSVPKYYRNIGRVWQEKGDLEKALPYFEQTVAAQEKATGLNHPSTGGAYNELASMLANLGQYEKALQGYQKGIAILEKTLPFDHPYVMAGYFNTGRVHEDMGDLELALKFYMQVLQKLEQRAEPAPLLIAQAEEQIAYVYLKLGDLDQAISRIQAAIKKLILPGGKYLEGEYENPELEDIQADMQMLDLLRIKSSALFERGSQKDQLQDLEAAFKTTGLMIELSERIRRNLPAESSRQELNEEIAEILDLGVSQSFALYEKTKQSSYLQRAYDISGMSKSSLLWQHLNLDQARQIAGLSYSEIENLQQLESRLQEAREDFMDAPDERTKRIRREVEIAYLQAEEDLSEKYPRYRELQFSESSMPIEKLSAHLPSNSTALLEYFYTDQELFLFLITRDGLQGWRQTLGAHFSADIASLHQAELGRLMGKKDAMGEYQKSLVRLYKLLIDPVRKALLHNRELIIIPHKQLHYLSFEMLAPEPIDAGFKQLDYLLRHFSIQYAWSSRLWYQESTRASDRSFAYNFLGFSPAFPEKEGLAQFRGSPYQLAYSQEEVEKANAQMEGQLLIGKEANKQTFLELASSGRIIHLATHGVADDQEPMQSGLFFSDQEDSLESDFLTALEIYGLDIPAELAVISACNTGYGKLAAGEGVMSLGRAFAYAGCKSILMSLWLANDRSTAKIMEYFYQNLSQGKPKQEALRQAKLSYLEQADPLAAHPYFWAGIVATGDMSPLKKSSLPAWAWGLIGLSIVGLFFFFWSRKQV